MIQFQLWSDIHLEISNLNLSKFKASAPILLLGGDIGIPNSDRYCALLNKLFPLYEYIFIICGNHEFYGSRICDVENEMNKMCTKISSNIIFLNNSTYDIFDDYRIVGTTLWSDIEDDQRSDINCFLADFRQIEGWTIGRNNARYKLNVKFLEEEKIKAISDNKKLIIMTHHAPLTNGVSQIKNHGSPLSSAFQSDLKYMITNPIKAWCFGHTHYCSHQFINNIQVISNQRGYTDEGINFNIYKVYIIK